MSSIQDSLSAEEKLSTDQQISQASERWPRKPWWMITRSSTGWNDLLRSDVSRLVMATPISRPLTSDELDALGEVASAVESARSGSRYQAAATYATAVWFYNTRRGLPMALSRQSSLYKAVFPTMIVWVLSGVALNTSARLTINSPRLQQFKRDVKAHAVTSRGQQPMSGPGPMAPRSTPQQQPLEQGIMNPSSTAQPEMKPGQDDSWLLAYERSRLRLERDIDYYTQSLQKLDQRLPEDGKSPGFMAGLGRKMAVATLEGKVRQYNELVVKENMRRTALGLPTIAGRHYPMPSEAAQRAGAFGADATEQEGGSEDDFVSEQQWGTRATQAAETAQREDAQPSWAPRSSQPGTQAQAPPSAPPQDDWDPIDEINADDASPVAPSARRRPRPAVSEGSAGSAWARLRQRALSGEQVSAPGPYDQQQSRLRPEKFSYDQAEEEKALAKDQAQKEFDAMLERERRGESDDGHRGGRNRWS